MARPERSQATDDFLEKLVAVNRTQKDVVEIGQKTDLKVKKK